MNLNHTRNTSSGEKVCPNLETCSLPGHRSVVNDSGLLERYRRVYCLTTEGYQGCRRFTVFQELGFCPVFVMPDHDGETEAIMERYDNGEE